MENEIYNNVQKAVHALYRQYGIPETEEESFVFFLAQKINQNADLRDELIHHPHSEDNMRFFVIREAILRREFFVKTPLGMLRVYAKHEDDTPRDFPGVFVDLVTSDFPDGDILACVEYNSSDGDLMTTVYQPGEDEPCEIVHHEKPNLARIETGPDGKLRYYDKNGTEILRGMKIRWDNGDVDVTYRADNDELGIDATNPSLVQKGKMNPCEMGIYPFTEDDLQKLEVVSWNTRVHYMYRDAANYKLPLDEIVRGEVPEEIIDDLDNLKIEGCLDTFHPEVIGFDASTFVSTGRKSYDDDPDCHELCYMEYTDQKPTVSMTAEEMVREMQTNPAVFS